VPFGPRPGSEANAYLSIEILGACSKIEMTTGKSPNWWEIRRWLENHGRTKNTSKTGYSKGSVKKCIERTLVPAEYLIEDPDPSNRKHYFVSLEGLAQIHLAGLGHKGELLGFDEEFLEVGKDVAHQIVDGKWQPEGERLARLVEEWGEACKETTTFDEAAAKFMGVGNAREFFREQWKHPENVSPEVMERHMIMLCSNLGVSDAAPGYREDFQRAYEKHFGQPGKLGSRIQGQP